jgi:ribosome-associated protein
VKRPALGPQDLQFHYIRAAGPGGQNVNKVASAVQLRFDLSGTQALSEEIKMRLRALAGARLAADGSILIHARSQRSQVANRREALARLYALIERAATPPKRRVPTRPSAAARRSRLDDKRARQRTKRLRGGIGSRDE